MNAGGGRLNAVSLKNLTKICQKITSHKIKISSKKTTSEYDIPYYVTDNSKVKSIVVEQKKVDSDNLNK